MSLEGLVSPATGAPLWPDTPHSLLGGPGDRWPVIDAIPYLRMDREELVRDTLARLDAGDRAGALAGLLVDQDPWWDGPAPERADLLRLVAESDRLTLRAAMALLGFGRVGDYFAHRWSDPTFLAGLALVEAHWNAPSRVFELACGIGHFLRELALRGVAAVGADIVFSKLWLARHWVVGPGAELVCFDASRRWPIPALTADLVLCHDAFYFLEPKPGILSGLRGIAGTGGVLSLGHIHNREAANLSAGQGVGADDIARLFPDGIVYDDAELTRAAAAARAPVPRPPAELAAVEAFSVAAGPGLVPEPKPVAGLITLPPAASALRLNPLYGAGDGDGRSIIWPSERYRREYENRATYPAKSDAPLRAAFAPALAEAVRRRELLALPERW